MSPLVQRWRSVHVCNRATVLGIAVGVYLIGLAGAAVGANVGLTVSKSERPRAVLNEAWSQLDTPGTIVDPIIQVGFDIGYQVAAVVAPIAAATQNLAPVWTALFVVLWAVGLGGISWNLGRMVMA